MLYDYRLSLLQMTQIKNWKKRAKLDHILLSIEDLELKTFEIESRITYKKTLPLNMFEKYAIRLIQRSEEIHSSITMNITQIANFLHLDKKLIHENLENLANIGMLNGLNSDIITINSNENAEYLQYENKFKKESLKNTYHLTKDEYENHNRYIQNIFEKDSQNRDKKFHTVDILNKKESVKYAYLLHYDNNHVLTFSQDGVNSRNDLKFLNKEILTNHKSSNIPSNTLCHYDEFLPFLRDKLTKNKEHLVILGTKEVDKNNLFILPKKSEDIYILSNSKEKHQRILNILTDDFLWIGDELYQREGLFIVQNENRAFKQVIKKKLIDYFLIQIKNIFPEYDNLKIRKIDQEIKILKSEVNQVQTKKETDLKVQELNTAKNRLYGIENKNPKKRSEVRKRIDKLEKENHEELLREYPIYLKNRKKILEYQSKVDTLKKQTQESDNLNKKINILHKKRATLLPKELKEEITPLEKELRKLERLKT